MTDIVLTAISVLGDFKFKKTINLMQKLLKISSRQLRMSFNFCLYRKIKTVNTNSQMGLMGETRQFTSRKYQQQSDNDDAQFFRLIHLVHPKNEVRDPDMGSPIFFDLAA